MEGDGVVGQRALDLAVQTVPFDPMRTGSRLIWPAMLPVIEALELVRPLLHIAFQIGGKRGITLAAQAAIAPERPARTVVVREPVLHELILHPSVSSRFH